MSEDTALVHCAIKESSYNRVIAPSDDPGIRAIPAEQIEWPEDAIFTDLLWSGRLRLGATMKYLAKTCSFSYLGGGF